MSRSPVPVALLAALILGALATPAAAQGTACTTPLDPACNHLKCYQIKEKASTVVSKSPLLRLDNQFGREVVYRLQAVLLCVPTQKSCCNATGCSPANCNPNPVAAPGLPHLKCYKIKAKFCPASDPTCASPVAFPKNNLVNLRDQFGTVLNVPVGNPRMVCVPVDKQHVDDREHHHDHHARVSLRPGVSDPLLRAVPDHGTARLPVRGDGTAKVRLPAASGVLRMWSEWMLRHQRAVPGRLLRRSGRDV
jgi:hypothetical protein